MVICMTRNAYTTYLLDKHKEATVMRTELHIDPTHHWIGASPDGIVNDPSSVDNPHGLLEAKCPASAESTSFEELCETSIHKLVGQKSAMDSLFLEACVSYKNLRIWEKSWCSRSFHLRIFAQLLLVCTMVRLAGTEELKVGFKQLNYTMTYR